MLRVIDNDTETCLEAPTLHFFLGKLQYNKVPEFSAKYYVLIAPLKIFLVTEWLHDFVLSFNQRIQFLTRTTGRNAIMSSLEDTHRDATNTGTFSLRRRNSPTSSPPPSSSHSSSSSRE